MKLSIERSSGILLHVSSLPNQYGIGTFGKTAYEFVDFLKKSGQAYWQILPLNPVAEGNSPYSTYSAFALNPYFIDLDLLADDEKRFVQCYLDTYEEYNIVWKCIEKVMSSQSKLSIIQMQDFLELGSEARMNIPGTAYGNWEWRVN